MRTSLLIAALLFASTALAQSRPDYSRDTLLRLLVEEKPPEPERSVRVHIGSVAFSALGTKWNFAYLPILAPLSGTRFGVTREFPDPFALTNTRIATSARVIRAERRALSRELKRIERTSAKLKVTTE